jgi:hypothetical protein
LGAFLTCETLFAPSVINQIRCLKDINKLVPHIESALEAQQAIIERLQRDLSKEKLCTSLTRVLHANKRTFAALKNAFGEWKEACAKGGNFDNGRKLQELRRRLAGAGSGNMQEDGGGEGGTSSGGSAARRCRFS